MSGWKEYTFKDLFEIPLKNGLNKPSKVRGSGFRMINMKEIFGYDFIGDETPMELVPLEEREKEFLKYGDLLFARQSLVATGAGKVAFYRGNMPTVFESHLIRCRINKSVSNSHFIYYLIKSPYGRNKIETIVEQTAAAGIRGSDLKELKFKIPDLPTQTAIAEILSSLDDKIELNNKINLELEQLAQTLFKQWFIDFEFPNENGEPYKSSGGEMVESELGEIPKGWEVKSLDKIADYLNGLALQKFPPINEFEFLPVIKIKELRQKDTSNSDKASCNIPEKYIIQNGDVLFSWSGSLLVDIWTNGKGALNQHLFKVTSNQFPKWFYYLWTKFHLSEFIKIAESKATTMGHIQRQHLTDAKVVIPNNIVFYSSIFEPIISKIIESRIENNELTNLRDTLLPKLISGELTVSSL